MFDRRSLELEIKYIGLDLDKKKEPVTALSSDRQRDNRFDNSGLLSIR